MRTSYYRILYQWILRRSVFSPGIKIRAPLKIDGPGKVLWGKGCVIAPGIHAKKGVTIVTHDANAEVIIGDLTILRGTSIGCVGKIAIGPQSLVDGAHIIDGDLHPKNPEARLAKHAVGPSDPVTIGHGSYVGPHSVLMKGAAIGDHVRIMAGSCLGKKAVGHQATVRGSPASIRGPRPS